MKKNLFITFPVDAGMKTSHDNYQNIFSKDFYFDSFSYKFNKHDNFNNFIKKKRYRILAGIRLRKIIKQFTKKKEKIIFHGMSPMIYTYGSYNFNSTILSLDATRALGDFIIKKKVKKDLAFYIHRLILKKISKILCWTYEVIEMVHSCYGIPKEKLFKILPPFEISKFLNYPRKTPIKPRVLFIGGDFKRKGGDIIIKNFDKIKNKCNLTIVTNNPKDKIYGINYLKSNLDNEKIYNLYNVNDILILPSKFDPYGFVLAEAASAGLAVITTKFALGSKDTVTNEQSGFICDTQEECIEKLEILLNNIELIDEFKHFGFNKIKKKFEKKKLHRSFIDHIQNI